MHKRLEDFIHPGETYGRWSVLKFSGNTGRKGGAMFLCRCACGVEREVPGYYLSAGRTRSCGCLRRDTTAGIAAVYIQTHGQSKTRAYGSWREMLHRCVKESDPAFHNYGGRGITVCDRWLKFENFLEDMGQRPKGLSIERIHNNGNYEPGNCRWATRVEQNSNQRRNVIIEIDGVSRTAAQWADEVGLARPTVYSRVSRGLTPKEVIKPI